MLQLNMTETGIYYLHDYIPVSDATMVIECDDAHCGCCGTDEAKTGMLPYR